MAAKDTNPASAPSAWSTSSRGATA
jgi:hypothetical protein